MLLQFYITVFSDQCLYVDGSLYAKGATWNVGCDYVCTCEDPTTNKYKCNARSVSSSLHVHMTV